MTWEKKEDLRKLENINLQTYQQFIKHTSRQRQNQPVSFECKSDTDTTKQTNKTSNLKTEIDRYEPKFLKNKKTRKALFNTLSPIIPVRRISSLPDNLEEGNYLRAAGLLGVAAIFLPEDYRDVRDGVKQLLGKFKPSYDFKEYQQPFSYFKGTLLEPLLRLKGKYGAKVGKWLQSQDIQLYHTKYGKLLKKIFNLQYGDMPIDTGKTYGRNKKLFAYNFKGNAIQKLVGRSLLRIPFLSVVTLALLELPAIVKSFNKESDNTKDKTKNVSKQLLKSATYLMSIFTGIGLAGAFLAKKGPAGSLLGMGVGAVAGSSVSNLVNKQIDKI